MGQHSGRSVVLPEPRIRQVGNTISRYTDLLERLMAARQSRYPPDNCIPIPGSAPLQKILECLPRDSDLTSREPLTFSVHLPTYVRHPSGMIRRAGFLRSSGLMPMKHCSVPVRL